MPIVNILGKCHTFFLKHRASQRHSWHLYVRRYHKSLCGHIINSTQNTNLNHCQTYRQTVIGRFPKAVLTSRRQLGNPQPYGASIHNNDVTMGAIASQITSLTIVCSRRRSKKTSKFRVTGLCGGNSPGEFTVEFPAQMASYAENVSIWWRHHSSVATPWNILIRKTDLVQRSPWCD